MISYKHLLITSAAVLTLIGCGGGSTQTNSVGTLGESLSVRMTDIGENLSNEEAVTRDTEALTLPKYINQDYQLPIEGTSGSDINWTLSNAGDFNITDRTLMIEDTMITQYAKLAAFINYDLNLSEPEANDTKEFCVTILPKATTAMEKVAQDITMVGGNHFPLTIDLNATDPYAHCTLTSYLAPNDSNISWKVCDSDLLELNATTGELTVKNPETILYNTCATIQATFQYGDVEKAAYFKVLILPQTPMMSYKEACDIVKAAAESLEIAGVDVALPLPSEDGDVHISWESCNPEIVTIDAEGNLVYTVTEATEAKLKATLKLGEVTKTVCIRVNLIP